MPFHAYLRAALVVVLLAGCAQPGQPAATPAQPPAQPPAKTSGSPSASPVGGASPSPAATLPAGVPSPSPAASGATPKSSGSPAPVVAGASPGAAVSAAAAFDPARVSVSLEPAWRGLSKPLGLTNAGDGSGRLFVVEQGGLIRIIADDAVRQAPFLDLRSQVSDIGTGYSERGLLGLVFHPNYRSNGFFFVNYTDRQGHTQIVRYRVSSDPNVADPGSARTVLTQQQPYPNHNGGHLAFGADGYLYIGLGDGGSANDPQGNGQSLGTLLGKMLRIDVSLTNDGEPYAVPSDNPFVGRSGARGEIWAYGLRNPWRYSFDRSTGDLYIADVGQNAWEEINVQASGSDGGENYGWNRMEGAHCRGASTCDQSGLTLPVAEYGRADGCSVTGGYAYRGSAQPLLTGTYFYGDYCSGSIWALVRRGADAWADSRVLQRQGVQVSSFGEDEAGEVYVTSLSEGMIYRLVGSAR